MNEKVFDRAKELVHLPPTQFGYSDVGDVLVSYLRGELSEEGAIRRLDYLNEDYEHDRARKGKSNDNEA